MFTTFAIFGGLSIAVWTLVIAVQVATEIIIASDESDDSGE